MAGAAGAAVGAAVILNLGEAAEYLVFVQQEKVDESKQQNETTKIN